MITQIANVIGRLSCRRSLHLDGFEHDGMLAAVGKTIRGEPAPGTNQSRHNLVFGGSKDPNHDAVMRIGGEAPKRRTHSSLRRKPRNHIGTPPPRTVISVLWADAATGETIAQSQYNPSTAQGSLVNVGYGGRIYTMGNAGSVYIYEVKPAKK